MAHSATESSLSRLTYQTLFGINMLIIIRLVDAFFASRTLLELTGFFAFI